MSTPEDARTVERDVAAPIDTVWSVLADGWSYANWVVGTARVRTVDDGWPAPDQRIHHSVGVWPFLLDDTTAVLEGREPSRLVLEARGWPLGKAHVTVELHPTGPRSCLVTIREDAVAGPGTLVPKAARQAMIVPRNREALRRLAQLAEGRAQASSSPEDPVRSPDQPTNPA